MLSEIKLSIKKILAWLGLYHPSLKIKISSEAKAEMIIKLKRSEHRILVETGTFKGDMLERLKNNFEKIYSVELDNDLYRNVAERFRGFEKIKLIQGDSAQKLKEILKEISVPTFFWLDAHPSGDINIYNTPILGELEAIFSHLVKNHTILIDDARKFDRESIKQIKSLSKANNYNFSIREGLFILSQ